MQTRAHLFGDFRDGTPRHLGLAAIDLLDACAGWTDSVVQYDIALIYTKVQSMLCLYC